MGEGEQSEGSGGIYHQLEDKYYDLCDWLVEKGMPVYQYWVEPIEKNGVPSFPISVIILFALLFAIGFGLGAFGGVGNIFAPQTASLDVSVLADGAAVAGAQVSLTIDGGKTFTATTDSGGTVSFSGLPKGARGVIEVTKDGYGVLKRAVVIGEPVTASLQASEVTPPPSQRTVVTFVDEKTQTPLDGVKVVYRDSKLGVQELASSADGKAELPVSDDTVTIFVSYDNYKPTREVITAGSTNKIVFLTAVTSPPPEGCTGVNCPQPKASVAVTVVDPDGNPVDGLVQLFESGNTAGPKSARTANGVALFEDAKAAGVTVYAVFTPDDTATFGNAQSESLTLAEGSNDLVVTVATRPLEGTIKIDLTVQDDAGSKISGARVMLFLAGSTDPVSIQETNELGIASFEAASNVEKVAIAYSPGLLPSDKLLMQSTSQYGTLVLKKPIAGNSGKVKVAVTDTDGHTQVAGADVELRYFEDNYPLGMPPIQTNEVGEALFELVPPDKRFIAVASYGAQRGKSAGFTGSAGNTVNVPVKLDKARGDIAILVRDPISHNPIANANATATVQRNPAGQCATNGQGTCVIKNVEANTAVTLSVNAPGYVVKTIDGLSVPALGILSVIIEDDLVPAALANESRLHVALYDPSCGTPIASSAIEKGRTYCVRVDFNLPTAQANPVGFNVRINGDGTADADFASVTYFQDLDVLRLTPDKLTIKRSNDYATAAGYSCDDAHRKSANKPIKWVNYEFQNVQGNKAILLKVFVKPSAQNGDKLSLNYFSYAARDGRFYRVPQDAVLSTQRSTAARDWCQATSSTAEYTIADGTVAYSKDGALGISFSQAKDGPRASSLATQPGNGFFVHFSGRLFSAPTAPFINVYFADPAGNKRAYALFNEFSYSIGGISLAASRIDFQSPTPSPSPDPTPTPTPSPTATPSPTPNATATPSPTPPPGPTNLTVTVTTCSSGSPLAGATVNAGNDIRNTDSHGVAFFPAMAPGQVQLSISATNYVTRGAGVQINQGQANTFSTCLNRQGETGGGGGETVGGGPINNLSEYRINIDPAAIPVRDGVWEVAGWLRATAAVPIPAGRVFAEFGDDGRPDNQVVVRSNASIRIYGTGQLVIEATPVQIYAGTDTRVVVVIRTAQGAPVTNTILSVNNIDGTDSPFGSQYSNGDVQLVGDNTRDRGQDGRYVFTLRPLRSGTFTFAAGGNYDPRFASGVLLENVVHHNFAEATPASLSLGCTAQTLSVRNSLDYSSAPIQVFVRESCVTVTGATCGTVNGNTNCSFVLEPLAEKTLTITPKFSGDCPIVVSSNPAPLLQSSQTVGTSIDCAQLESSCAISFDKDFVTGGAQGTVRATATFANLRPSDPATNISCDYPDAEGTRVGISGGVARRQCTYAEVGGFTEFTVHAVSDGGVECSQTITVLPPSSVPTCSLTSRPINGTTIARLSADFFNLPTSIQKAFFFCTPNDDPHEVDVTPSEGVASATFDCDYATQNGGLFNASAAAGTAFCFNPNVRLTPQDSCALGGEQLRFGNCSTSASWLRCDESPSNPAIAQDAACCSEVLGSGRVLKNSPSVHCGPVNPPQGKCDDGIASPGECGSNGAAPLPLRCGNDFTFATDGACCAEVLGYTYDASRHACIKPSTAGKCVVTDGTTNVVTDYGVCSTVYSGQKCEGDASAPALKGENACCPQGQVYNDNAKKCVPSNQGSSSCSSFADPGRSNCLRPNAVGVPAPFQCSDSTLQQEGACCTNIVSNGKKFRQSTDGNYCVEIPANELTPDCTLNVTSYTRGSVSEQGSLNATLVALNGFGGGSGKFDYSCDRGVAQTRTQTFTISNTPGVTKGLQFNCDYPRQWLDYSVMPATAAIVSNNERQASIACTLGGPADVIRDGVIIVRGTSGANLTFTAKAFAGSTDWTQLTERLLGPLSSVTLKVKATSLPTGVTSSQVHLTFVCDSSEEESQQQMTASRTEQNTWTGFCSYASARGTAFPATHSARAFYQIEATNQSGTFIIPPVPAGINAGFPPILEYDAPVAAGFAEFSGLPYDVLHAATPQDQSMKVGLSALFTGLPPSINAQFTTDCGNGGQTVQASALASTDGKATAKFNCTYSSGTPQDFTVKARFDYKGLSGNRILAANAENTGSVAYAPSGSNAACTFDTLPAQIIAGDPNLNNFQPIARVLGLVKAPKSVRIDCGNGAQVDARLENIAGEGQSVAVKATARTACRYDFSFLQEGGTQVQFKDAQLAVFVDGGDCEVAGGSEVHVVSDNNTPTLALAGFEVTPATGDQLNQDGSVKTPGTNAVASFTPTATAAHAIADATFSAKIDCGTGSTTAGSPTTVQLPDDGSGTVFAADGQSKCEYKPVVADAQRKITVSLYRTAGSKTNKVGSVQNTFTQVKTPAQGAEFQACNNPMMMMLMFGQMSGEVGVDQGVENSERAALLRAQAQKLADQGKAIVLNADGFATSPAATSRTAYLSSVIGSFATEPVPVVNLVPSANPITFDVNVPGDGASCLTPSIYGGTPNGQSSVKLKTGQTAAVAFRINPAGCQNIAQIGVEIRAQVSGSPRSSIIIVSIVKLNGLDAYKSVTAPGNTAVQLRTKAANPQEPFVINAQYQPLARDAFPQGVTSAIVPFDAAKLEKLVAFDVVGNSLSSDPNAALGCSGKDFCTPKQAQAAADKLAGEIAAAIGPVSSKRTDSVPQDTYMRALADELYKQNSVFGNQVQQNGGLQGGLFSSPLGLLAMGGFGGNTGGSQACAAMMQCTIMMKQLLKNNAALGPDAQALPLIFCSDKKVQESLSKGDSSQFTNLFILSSLSNRVQQQKGTIKTGGGYVIMRGQGQGAQSNYPLSIPIRVSQTKDSESSMQQITCDIRSELDVKCSPKPITNGRVGQPFLDSSGIVQFDEGKRNLYTMNKYGATDAADCHYHWSSNNLVDDTSGCNIPAVLTAVNGLCSDKPNGVCAALVMSEGKLYRGLVSGQGFPIPIDYVNAGTGFKRNTEMTDDLKAFLLDEANAGTAIKQLLDANPGCAAKAGTDANGVAIACGKDKLKFNPAVLQQQQPQPPKDYLVGGLPDLNDKGIKLTLQGSALQLHAVQFGFLPDEGGLIHLQVSSNKLKLSIPGYDPTFCATDKAGEYTEDNCIVTFSEVFSPSSLWVQMPRGNKVDVVMAYAGYNGGEYAGKSDTLTLQPPTTATFTVTPATYNSATETPFTITRNGYRGKITAVGMRGTTEASTLNVDSNTYKLAPEGYSSVVFKDEFGKAVTVTQTAPDTCQALFNKPTVEVKAALIATQVPGSVRVEVNGKITIARNPSLAPGQNVIVKKAEFQAYLSSNDKQLSGNNVVVDANTPLVIPIEPEPGWHFVDITRSDCNGAGKPFLRINYDDDFIGGEKTYTCYNDACDKPPAEPTT
jgi:hypothetical protein